MGKRPKKYHLGEVFREVRQNKGIAITKVSDSLHRNKSTISRFETGQAVITDLDLIVDWASALGSKEPLKTACKLCPIFTALYAAENRRMVH